MAQHLQKLSIPELMYYFYYVAKFYIEIFVVNDMVVFNARILVVNGMVIFNVFSHSVSKYILRLLYTVFCAKLITAVRNSSFQMTSVKFV